MTQIISMKTEIILIKFAPAKDGRLKEVIMLNRKEVAEMLDISPNTVTTKQGKGLFPMPDKRVKGLNGNDRVYWKKESIEEYIQTNGRRKALTDKAKSDKELIIERLKTESVSKIAKEYQVSDGLIRSFIRKPSPPPAKRISNEFIPPSGYSAANKAFNLCIRGN